MVTILRNGEIYDPEYVGQKDILIVDEKIFMIKESINLPSEWMVTEIDCSGKIIVPGFIDGHVHICGGGSKGYRDKVPEISLVDLTRGGTTTIVSFLGTDSSTKTIPMLIGKAKGLQEEGLTCKLLFGSYVLPTISYSGDLIDDIVLMDDFIGVKAAISDTLQVNGTEVELAKAISNSALAGLISGKAGVSVLHVGKHPKRLDMLRHAIETYDLPIEKILPTHINRSAELLCDGFLYVKEGGRIDLTTNIYDLMPNNIELKCSKIFKKMIDEKMDISKVTFSTDGNGIFRKPNSKDDLDIFRPDTLYREFRDSVLNEGIDVSSALKPITTNVANFFGLMDKGHIAEGKSGDVNILDKDTLEINTVISRGKIMIKDGEIVTWGSFDKAIMGKYL